MINSWAIATDVASLIARGFPQHPACNSCRQYPTVHALILGTSICRKRLPPAPRRYYTQVRFVEGTWWPTYTQAGVFAVHTRRLGNMMLIIIGRTKTNRTPHGRRSHPFPGLRGEPLCDLGRQRPERLLPPAVHALLPDRGQYTIMLYNRIQYNII